MEYILEGKKLSEIAFKKEVCKRIWKEDFHWNYLFKDEILEKYFPNEDLEVETDHDDFGELVYIGSINGVRLRIDFDGEIIFFDKGSIYSAYDFSYRMLVKDKFLDYGKINSEYGIKLPKNILDLTDEDLTMLVCLV